MKVLSIYMEEDTRKFEQIRQEGLTPETETVDCHKVMVEMRDRADPFYCLSHESLAFIPRWGVLCVLKRSRSFTRGKVNPGFPAFRAWAIPLACLIIYTHSRC